MVDDPRGHRFIRRSRIESYNYQVTAAFGKEVAFEWSK